MKKYYATVMVLTDVYPPNVMGGAELSLHALLKVTNRFDVKTVVVTLDKDAREVTHDFFEGIEIYRVPFDESWPKFSQNASRLRRYRTALAEYRLHRSFGDKTYYIKAKTIAGMYRRHPGAMGVLPLFDRQALCHNNAISVIREIANRIAPDLIHADNYRSIVMAGALNLRKPVISLVRDNRFFCAHRNQAMNVDGEICRACSFECVDGKAEPKVEAVIKTFMEEVRDLRVEALRNSAEVVVTSDYLLQQIHELAPDVPLSKVPNITESPERVAQYTRGIPRSSPPEILCVGMISHNKGQMHVAQHLARFDERIRNYKLVFAGRGGLSRGIDELLGRAQLRDKVQFTGFLSRTELYRCYARATVVICPNIWPEPFGRVPLEAALAGTPVVAYDTGGIDGNIEHGKTGYLVDQRDADALFARVAEFCEHPEQAEQMGQAALAYASKRHAELNPGGLLLDVWSRHL